jgi:hypothetical protein
VFYAPHRRPEHANREPLVLQTQPPLSMQHGSLWDFGFDTDWEAGRTAPGGATGETSDKKRRLLVEEGDISQMTERKTLVSQAPPDVEKIPEDLSVEMRRIAHDLSNALEIIIQTSYLLSTTEMKEPASDWLRMLDDGVQKAMSLNLELRTYIKDHTSS